MGLLHDKRHFDFSAGTPGWETLATLPLGFLTKGMYYRESIEISFKAKGLTPRYVFESDSTFPDYPGGAGGDLLRHYAA